MTTIPRDFINDLLNRVDIVEIINRRVTLKKNGANYSACCPFHTEKTPSFTVSPQKQFYHCFGCGAHGTALGFLMAFDKLEFPEAVEELANYLGVPIPREVNQAAQQTQLPLYPLLEKVARYYQSQLSRAQVAQNYLKNRGLSEETIQKFSIGYAPNGWDNVLRQFPPSNHLPAQLIETGMLIKSDGGKIYDRFRNRIMIPIRDNRGRIIAFGGRTLGEEIPKYLNSPETPLFHKGSQLYGLYEARQANSNLPYAIVVEGYMDVIALHQYGITQAVATLGTATTPQHLMRLFRYTQQIYFCFDGDKAGLQAAWRALENSLSVMQDGIQISFIFLPEGEDPDSMIRKQGLEAFQQQIQKAIPLADFFFAQLSAKINIKSLEGKAKLASLANGLLDKIRPGIFRDLMTEQLASLLGMRKEVLEQNLQKAAPPQRALPAAASRSKLLPPIQQAIALLLQYPNLGRDLPERAILEKIELPGIKALLKIFEILQSNPNLSSGALLEYWRGTKIANTLAKLATWDLLIPPEGAQGELLGAIEKAIHIQYEQQIQTLITKGNQGELTTEEKAKLMQLLKERTTTH